MKVVKRSMGRKKDDEVVATDEDYVVVILRDGTEFSLIDVVIKAGVIDGKQTVMNSALDLNLTGRSNDPLKVMPRAANSVWLAEDR